VETRILLIYDIEEDALRTRISETCKDYGLERIQYSAFMGRLSINRRQELFLKVSDLMGSKTGKVVIVPICEKDYREKREKVNESESGK